jgi:hypothetical protein
MDKGSHDNKYLQSSYVKYGKENFKWEIIKYLEKVENKEKLREELLKWEQHYIDRYIVEGSVDSNICYNLAPTAGSVLGTKNPMTEETKKKISEATKGKNLGKEPPNKGTKMSEEQRVLLSSIAIKTKRKPPSREGLGHTEETKKKMSKRMEGNNYGSKLKGIPKSEETKKKIKESWKKRKENKG